MNIERQCHLSRRNFLQSAGVGALAYAAGASPVAAQPAAPTELLVNTSTAGAQQQPAISAVSFPRHFIVAWTDKADGKVKLQRFSGNGAKMGGETAITSSAAVNTDRRRPILSMTPGGLVAVWIEQAINPPGPISHVHLQRLSLEGKPLGGQVQVSATAIDPNQRPAITSLIDGGFLVTWADARADRRIRARRFQIDGAPSGSEFAVNTNEGFHENPIVTRLAGQDAGGNHGNYVIAWRSDPSPPGGGALTLRIFNHDGTPVTGEIRPNISGFGGQKAMTSLDNGRFVTVHVRSGVVSDLGVLKSIVEANVFEANGAFANVRFSATTGQDINSSAPAVAALPGGQFLVAWVQKSAETFSTTPTVRAKVLSDSAGSIGQEAILSSATAGLRNNVCAAAIADAEGKTAFVAWDDSSGGGGDSSDLAVRGRQLRILSGGIG